MSIYRPPKRHWPYTLAYSVGALVVGLLLGMAMFGGEQTSQSDVVSDVKLALSGARANLDVAKVEYRESVQAGRVVRAPEYRGALAALSRSRSRINEVREVLDLIPYQSSANFNTKYDEIGKSMRLKADPSNVDRQIDELSRAIRGSSSP